MRTLLTSIILAAAAAIGASASSAAPLEPEAKLARLLEGRVAGKPVNCLSLRNIRSTQIIDDTAIVYRVGSTLYVNRPRTGANWLDRDDILITRTMSSQLCRIDTVELVDRTALFPSGFLNLGEFVPYARPEN